MKIPYLTTRQGLSKYLKDKYLSKKYYVQIIRPLNMAIFERKHRNSQIPTHITELRVIDTTQYEPSDSLIKMMKVMCLVKLSERLYRELEEELEIEVEYHFQSVNGFCKRLVTRREKLLLLAAVLNEPDL